jgi:hypothetical protein
MGVGASGLPPLVTLAEALRKMAGSTVYSVRHLMSKIKSRTVVDGTKRTNLLTRCEARKVGPSPRRAYNACHRGGGVGEPWWDKARRR